MAAVDIDDDALERVMALSGAKTMKEAVNLALQYYADRQERTARIARHYERARHWGALEDAERLSRCEDLLSHDQLLFMVKTKFYRERPIHSSWQPRPVSTGCPARSAGIRPPYRLSRCLTASYRHRVPDERVAVGHQVRGGEC
jgi:Arc/MetJ family transcription regulator